ncbi:sulfatase-like hydrolase/transferase [Tahibacter caeni]|uniref:sulfatase-like hydrolase/transferase n=1 Tax=Tahibacter caeni TaxID=1453545 RepID=UPI00214755DB|nr:sulfatase-like hydrolase/transferase [Tahibacter caeni]
MKLVLGGRWALLASLALCLAGCGKPPAPNVLVVTIDTLRPDALGFVNRNPATATPVLDALAQEGTAFTGAVSPVPLTLPAHLSLFSARIPHAHGVHDNGQTVPADLPLLAETLRSRGYATGAFVSGFPLQSLFGLDRGFDRYDDQMPAGQQGWVERRAEDTVAAAAAWFDAKDRAKPWFGWVHFYDPHDPYEPPREFWQPGPRGAYDGEVAYVDYWLGRLVAKARSAGGDRPLLIVVTADHAEALGEHAERTHGFFVYDSTLKIPLVFHWAGEVKPQRSDAPVRLIDVAPTILDLLGLPALPGAEGKSIAAGLRGAPIRAEPAVVETWLPWVYYGWSPLVAWRDATAKYIAAPAAELYDLAADPGEAHNLAEQDVVRADRLALSLAAATAAPAGVAGVSDDAEAVQRLRSLGYIGVGAPPAVPTGQLADPKDRIGQREQLRAADSLARAGRQAEAAAAFEAVLVDDPDNRFALLRAGTAALQAGQADKAVAHLSRSVQLEPRRAEARYAYADALMRLGRYDEAAEHWAALAELQPRRPEAWFNLAAALERAGHAQRAEEAMTHYRRLKPERP